jgi:hypothetical protein
MNQYNKDLIDMHWQCKFNLYVQLIIIIGSLNIFDFNPIYLRSHENDGLWLIDNVKSFTPTKYQNLNRGYSLWMISFGSYTYSQIVEFMHQAKLTVWKWDLY